MIPPDLGTAGYGGGHPGGPRSGQGRRRRRQSGTRCDYVVDHEHGDLDPPRPEGRVDILSTVGAIQPRLVATFLRPGEQPRGRQPQRPGGVARYRLGMIEAPLRDVAAAGGDPRHDARRRSIPRDAPSDRFAEWACGTNTAPKLQRENEITRGTFVRPRGRD